MRLQTLLIFVCTTLFAVATTTSVQGIKNLVKRRLPAHVNDFEFEIVNEKANNTVNDEYCVSSLENGKILVEGNSLSALAVGLHRYLTDVVHVDIYWYIGSRLFLAPSPLPTTSELKGASTVPWRYHFNTVTFSYTTAFWTWDDWQLELDWLALRGVNLPLAWVGIEKIMVEVFQEIGLTNAEINDFLSGPAFQAWNRFGNIQGSWGGDLPMAWINDQFALQKKIVARMVELGQVPILPAFTGFVPRSTSRVLPDANITIGSQWEAFPTNYTEDSFLNPLDPAFSKIQSSFISKQLAAYGNVTHIFTLDQYNENNPYSGDLAYLQNVSYGTWQSLKAADPDAVWLMQGWLFFSNEAFWTTDRVEAYLGGIQVNEDSLILDLFSESAPQWQRTSSYFGKPWIWCQLHDYGGNLGLYGQIENVTINPVEALANSSSLVGFGLTMEGQEGNEIMYDLLLDQAWSAAPLDTADYFRDWVTSRYAGSTPIPEELYTAWEMVRTTVYNNTYSPVQAVVKSILELTPSTTGLINRTGHHPTTLTYQASVLVDAWNLMYTAADSVEPGLWDNPAFAYDMVDFTRQVLSNAFIPAYQSLIASWNTSTTNTTTNTTSSTTTATKAASKHLLNLLTALNTVLSTHPSFTLSTYLHAARTSAPTTSTQNFFEYDARNQLTLWGPTGQISDYASKVWGGLVSSYYLPRWKMFVGYLEVTTPRAYNQTVLARELLAFEEGWQTEIWGERSGEVWGTVGVLESVLAGVKKEFPVVFKG